MTTNYPLGTLHVYLIYHEKSDNKLAFRIEVEGLESLETTATASPRIKYHLPLSMSDVAEAKIRETLDAELAGELTNRIWLSENIRRKDVLEYLDKTKTFGVMYDIKEI